jgi:S1-C subfamily serine protease/mono/diheme cytochrome c family protein
MRAQLVAPRRAGAGRPTHGRSPALVLLVLALLLRGVAAVAAPGGASAARASVDAGKLVFLLEYIALDYELAVQDGAIADPFEYREMEAFTTLLVERFDDLRAAGAPEDLRAAVVDLRNRVRRLEPAAEIRELARSLVERLVEALDVVPLPVVAPEIERGRALYAEHCAACHGSDGDGKGPSAEGMAPPPTSFRERRMARVAPRQIYGAVTFGIDGTAMPAYRDELTQDQIWDVAFFLMTLRDGFDPRSPEVPLPLTLPDLASRSGDELLAAMRAERDDVDSAHIDHYRAAPRAVPVAPPVPVATEALGVGEDAPGLQVARQLQDAFSMVAERAGPSVVGVTGFVREERAVPRSPEPEGGWGQEAVEERLYPGFHRARSGSGFIVSAEGHILTAQHLLRDAQDETVDAVDIELDDGRHEVARIVGIEPTINLAVLQLETFSATGEPAATPVRLATDGAARVGHWVIALGNPWGPGRTFAVGTLSSQPERHCYQEDLTATLVQAAVSVPPGAHGGPLVDIEGAVVGVLVPAPRAVAAEPGLAPAGVAFALPIDLAMSIYEPLKLTKSRTSPWLGISVLELSAVRRRAGRPRDRDALPRTGVYIDDVYTPSPAAEAGIRIGDSLLAIDGARLLSVRNFQKWLYLSGVGRTVTLEIFRDGETLEKRVTVAQRPAAAVPR